MAPPLLDQHLGFLHQRVEDLPIEQLVLEPGIEALAVALSHKLNDLGVGDPVLSLDAKHLLRSIPVSTPCHSVYVTMPTVLR